MWELQDTITPIQENWVSKHSLYFLQLTFTYCIGAPVGVRTDKEMMDMDKIIKDTLQDDQHVWIVLKGDEIPPEIQAPNQ